MTPTSQSSVFRKIPTQNVSNVVCVTFKMINQEKILILYQGKYSTSMIVSLRCIFKNIKSTNICLLRLNIKNVVVDKKSNFI